MKWVFGLILILAGLFYAGKKLMPSPTVVDTTWMAPQIHIGMSEDQVQQTIAGEPSSIDKSGIGNNVTWFYQDRYKSDTELAIQFIGGRVVKTDIIHSQ